MGPAGDADDRSVFNRARDEDAALVAGDRAADRKIWFAGSARRTRPGNG